MGVGGQMILGGLLQGVGAGVTKLADERRQNALLALKRQYDVEDRDANIAGSLAAKQIEIEGRKEVIGLTGEENRKTEKVKQEGDIQTERVRGEETRKTETIKFSNETALTRLSKSLDQANDAASIKLKAELDGGQIDSVEAAEDGTMLVTYKNGTVVPKNVKLREKTRGDSDDDGEGSISAELNAREGGAKPAQPTNTPKKDDATRNRAYNALARSYATATPQTHPSFFVNGKKRSKAELQAEIDKLTGF